jgi:hypothetical protein|tara:strand:+ start:576 stop:1049 length:474 start_codon:yes stop_codon:yes gene_type:complete
MKLLIENWRKYLNEDEELSNAQKIASMVTDVEGFLSALAIAESINMPLEEWVPHISRNVLGGVDAWEARDGVGIKSILQDPRIPSAALLWLFKYYSSDEELDYSITNKISRDNPKVLKMLEDDIENLDSDSAELVTLIKRWDKSHSELEFPRQYYGY